MEPETEAERGLIAAATSGQGYSATGEDADRAVRPEFLRALLARQLPPCPSFRDNRLMAGRLIVTGDLDLSGLGTPAEPLPQLVLQLCRFQRVNLTDCHIQSLNLDGSDLTDLNMRSIRVQFDVRLSLVDVIGEVRMHNARIGGNLSMNGTVIDARPRRTDPETGAVDLPLPQAPYTALYADGVQIEGDVFMRPNLLGTNSRPFISHGTVRFIGTRISGDVSMNGAVLYAPLQDVGEGKVITLAAAATFERSVIGGCFFGTPQDGIAFESLGELSFNSARLAGGIELQGALLGFTRRPGGEPLSLDLSECECQTLTLAGMAGDFPDGSAEGTLVRRYRPFTANGEVRLIGTVVRGQVSISGAYLNGMVDSLCAHNARIDGGMWLTVPGRLDDDIPADRQPPAFSARVMRRFTLGGATIRRLELTGLLLDPLPIEGVPFVPILDLAGATITSDLIVSLHPDSRGKVSLENAHVGNLPHIAAEDWGAAPTTADGGKGVLLDLDELSYDRADVSRVAGSADPGPWWRRLGGSSRDADMLLAWLQRQYADNEPNRDSFRPQPFEQVAKLLRAKGDRYGAGRIASAKRQLQRRSSLDRGLGWVGNWIFWLFFDYGYSPGRALAWGLAFVLLGLAGTWWVAAGDGLVKVRPDPKYRIETVAGQTVALPERTSAQRCTEPLLGYALDSFLPLIDLGFDSACEISDERGFRHPNKAEAARLIYAFIGLIFVPVAALTFAGVLRSD